MSPYSRHPHPPLWSDRGGSPYAVDHRHGRASVLTPRLNPLDRICPTGHRSAVGFLRIRAFSIAIQIRHVHPDPLLDPLRNVLYATPPDHVRNHHTRPGPTRLETRPPLIGPAQNPCRPTHRIHHVFRRG